LNADPDPYLWLNTDPGSRFQYWYLILENWDLRAAKPFIIFCSDDLEDETKITKRMTKTKSKKIKIKLLYPDLGSAFGIRIPDP